MLIQLLQHYRRTSRDVQLQPLLLVTLVQRLEVSIVRDGRVGKSIAAKLGIIGIENLLVRATRHEQALVAVRVGRTEVEDKQQIVATISQYLVAVVAVDLHHLTLLILGLCTDKLYHCLVKLTEVFIA